MDCCQTEGRVVVKQRGGLLSSRGAGCCQAEGWVVVKQRGGLLSRCLEFSLNPKQRLASKQYGFDVEGLWLLLPGSFH